MPFLPMLKSNVIISARANKTTPTSAKSGEAKTSPASVVPTALHDSLPQPDLYGWTKNNDSNYVFDWECPSVQKLVLETITFLT